MSEVFDIAETLAYQLEELLPNQSLELKIDTGGVEETWYSFNNNSQWRFAKDIEPIDEETIAENEILDFDQMVEKCEGADIIHYSIIDLNVHPLDIEKEVRALNSILETGIPDDLDRKLLRLVSCLPSNQVLTIVFGEGRLSQGHEFSTWFAVRQLDRIIFIENISENLGGEDTAEIVERLSLEEFKVKLKESYSSGHTVFYRNVVLEI